MSNLLLDETPLVLSPSLATWIGLNESIFLQQLHYILKEYDSLGKVADNARWYRDKPRDFVVKYFPFWDEGIVKRTIANLRKDGLILARSDLNKNAKDRSLWYTINYPAVERLEGPVERLVKKSEMRRAARQAREDVDSNEYTKVQNVLLQKESTKRTNDLGTNCTSTQVQNVPTPKEILPKDSKPKESTPKGGKPLSEKQTASRAMFSALVETCAKDLAIMTDKDRGKFNQAEKKMRENGYTPDDIRDFLHWWQRVWWMGRDQPHPELQQIREHWGKFLAWRRGQADRDPIPVATEVPEVKPLDKWHMARQQLFAYPWAKQWLANAEYSLNGQHVLRVPPQAEHHLGRVKKTIDRVFEQVFGDGVGVRIEVLH